MGSQNQAPAGELFLQLHLTSRCNLRCTHCYVDGEAIDMPPELFGKTLNDFEEMRRARNPARWWTQLTGGEPLAHPSFWEFLDEAAARMTVKVLTNGTLIDAAEAKKLAARCLSVQISFEGLEGEHDRVRGCGAFAAALRGLEALNAAGCRTVARVTVTASNIGQILPLLDMLKDRVYGFCVSRVVPIGACRESMPAVDAYRRLIYDLYRRGLEGEPVSLKDPFFGPLVAVDEPGCGFSGCSAGFGNVCVTERGDVMPCRRLPIVLGNVSGASLPELFDRDALVAALRERRLLGNCRKCEDKATCGGSRCIAYAVNGDALGGDPGCIFHQSGDERRSPTSNADPVFP